MATRHVPKTPSLCLHKPSGKGFVRLNGTVIYLGPFGEPETERRYHELIAEWVAAGRQAKVEPDTITIEELVARFWVYAQRSYARPDGGPTSELDNLRQACRPLTHLYASTRAAEFGPLALKAVRQNMIDRGWCRSNVNKMVGRLKTVFRWAAENELVPGSVHHALTAVAGLKRGRCGVRDTDPVRCVPQQYVDAIQPFVSKQVWTMVQLQIFTAARAGELVIMRSCDIDRSSDIWLYRPTEHKTAHHGHSRSIYIGPRGQQALTPFLLRPEESYCFSPAEAEAERRRQAHEARETPLGYGNRPGTNRRSHPRLSPGERYDVASYRRAIERACAQAWPLPAHLAQLDNESHDQWRTRIKAAGLIAEVRAWRKSHRWHPHQLRHNAATGLRKEFNLEAARIILGHRSAAITEVYAELDQQKAIDAMRKYG